MENNYDVFKYLKPEENTKISDLNCYDLEKLISLINGYNLEYRNGLFIPGNISFGVEVEYSNPQNERLYPDPDQDEDYRHGWILRKEGTVKNGGELVSPILNNHIDNWRLLKCILSDLHNRVDVIDTCGSHVHIGAHIIGENPRNLNNFLRLWSTYENIIFRFAYGEYLNGRDSIKRMAKPLRREIENYYKAVKSEYGDKFDCDKISPFDMDDFINHIQCSEYHAVSFFNVTDLSKFKMFNTIEFRLANGTINHIIWQNLINAYIHLILYAKSSDFDYDLVVKREKELKFPKFEYVYYKDLDIKMAVEFADLVFDKNIDKIYFLRQYLKNNEETDKTLTLEKAKNFTV